MVWDDATGREIERIVSRIPPLSEMEIADLFRAEDWYDGKTHPDQFQHISDPDDRKFAALAEAAGAVLITSGDHLLSVRGQIATAIQTPGEFWRQLRD
jgi:predicted nucleic acid-binding protein